MRVLQDCGCITESTANGISVFRACAKDRNLYINAMRGAA